MKIYTKTGDKGQTGVIGGRIPKNSVIINTLGTFDELNASLGICIALSQDQNVKELQKIQNIIFNIGSVICGATIDCDFTKQTKNVESQIDKLEKQLPPLTNFILPGGIALSANIHLSRTICRRAERQLVEYIDLFQGQKPESMNVDVKKLIEIQKFTNRLSDYLFVLARFANKSNNIPDVIWNKLID